MATSEPVEPTIRIEKAGPGLYRVTSDCLDGRMEFAGYVEKRDGLWLARTAGSTRLGPFKTRKLAIEALH